MSLRARTAERIRLLIVSQPLEAGVTRHVLDVVRLLDATRYEIDVACPRESDLWTNLADVAGVRRHAIAPHRQPAFADVGTLRSVLALVRRADIVHAHSSKAGFLTRLAAAGLGRSSSCLFTPHGWSFWSTNGALARAYRSLERMAARWCRTIIAVSQHERRAGIRSGIGTPAQYRVIHNGVDVRRFAEDYAPVNGRILMVGRLAAPKRQDIAIRAVRELRSYFPHLSLHLIGDGPERPRLERLVDDLGVRSHVRLYGTRSDIPALLAKAQCVVLASDSEACPLSIMEGMAAGAPVVASRIGGVPEIVEDGHSGLLVAPGSVAELATALRYVLTTPAHAASMGTAGRHRIQQRFSSQRMVDETVQVYETLAHEG